MVRVSKRGSFRQGHGTRPRIVGTPDLTALQQPHQAAAQLGPVVYFIRTYDGLVKIGYTTNFKRRRKELTYPWENVLAVIPGSFAHEHALHEMYRASLVRGRETFELTPDLLAHINEIRESCGVHAIAS